MRHIFIVFAFICLLVACGPSEQDKQIEAWQHLVDTGLAWSLQGWFGRTAMDLIEQGIIERKNK